MRGTGLLGRIRGYRPQRTCKEGGLTAFCGFETGFGCLDLDEWLPSSEPVSVFASSGAEERLCWGREHDQASCCTCTRSVSGVGGDGFDFVLRMFFFE